MNTHVTRRRPSSVSHFGTEVRRKGSMVAWCLMALILLIPLGLLAQDNATITGTASDSSGAVVPNANITLTNTATGVVRESTVNSVGAYRFGNVAAGTYTLTARAAGFQKY